MIAPLSSIFGSKTKAQEVMFLLHDLKDVVRQGFYEQELPAVEMFCRNNKLFLVKSRFKVLLADQSADIHYSNKGLRIPEQDTRPGMCFIYLSKDERKAWLASYYEMMRNDKALGLLLGSPPCCVDFFCQNFNAQKTNLQAAPANMWTNLTKRDQDAVLLSHFPCTSNCQESISMAMRYLDLLATAEPQRARELTTLLKVS